jgi:branched-chain amino acid transport system substrate-binding protein
MRTRLRHNVLGRGWAPSRILAWAFMAGFAMNVPAQKAAKTPSSAPAGPGVCECGAHPPGPPRDREVTPYAGEPADLSPFAKFAAPYDHNYTHPNVYSGAGRDIPDPTDLTEVRIGFLGPIEHHPQQVFGMRMLHGAQLAIEDANAHGGYGGIPYRLMLHNDYDNWQAKTVYGDQRPTDSTIWGSASNEVVKMVYDEHDWAIFGSISSESTHIALRVALRAEISVVNSASTDPTIPETYIPWYFTDIQDDRVQSLTLARRIFTELGLKRVALLRVNERYGRFGVPKFRDAARRLGHPVVIEQKFYPGDTDFAQQLRVIRSSRADAVVLWADESAAASILKQMRGAGMKQPVFGAHRTLGSTFLAVAGPAAEGFEAVFPYDPTRQDPRWIDFSRRFQGRFQEEPEQFAALAYDAMTMLLESICKAGLNRARIHDALANIESYDGVTGRMTFDPNQKNVAPLFLGRVHDGKVHYRVATMDKQPAQPYAHLGDDPVAYSGPHQMREQSGPASLVLFGTQAAQLAQSQEMLAMLAGNGGRWKLLPISIDAINREGHNDWGAASSALVHALTEEHPFAIIALDRASAHLAEQLSLKVFVPVIAISDDTTLTSTNVPWIFRLPGRTKPLNAVQLAVAALDRCGANAEKLRDLLASGRDTAGFVFRSNGEPNEK